MRTSSVQRDEAALGSRARLLADEVLFPAAIEIDRDGVLPRALLDVLAAEGFYGISADPADGGLDGAGLASAAPIVEALAGGCLSAAFVWLQHLGVVRGVSASADSAVRERWLAPLVSGETRAGIALAGLRPGPDQVRITATDTGWAISGRAPWLTGWDHIDVVYLAGLDSASSSRKWTTSAESGPTLTVHRADLMAVQASSTVEAVFRGHQVTRDRLVATTPLADWTAKNAFGSALNGFLALGVAGRCALLMETEAFDADLSTARASLLIADPAGRPVLLDRLSGAGKSVIPAG